jgi:hypothetical protein
MLQDLPHSVTRLESPLVECILLERKEPIALTKSSQRQATPSPSRSGRPCTKVDENNSTLENFKHALNPKSSLW